MPRRQSKARPKPKKNQHQIDRLVEELIVKKKEGNGGESEQEKQEEAI